MTTFSYSLTLGDTECIAVGAALDLLIAHCDKELASSSGPPYFAWRNAAERVEGRLHANATHTSGSYTDPDSREYRIWIGDPPSDPSTKP